MIGTFAGKSFHFNLQQGVRQQSERLCFYLSFLLAISTWPLGKTPLLLACPHSLNTCTPQEGMQVIVYSSGAEESLHTCMDFWGLDSVHCIPYQSLLRSSACLSSVYLVFEFSKNLFLLKILYPNGGYDLALYWVP